MSVIISVLMLVFHFIVCINEYNSYSETTILQNIQEIEPGLSNTYFIQYEKQTFFSFNIDGQEKIQVNIHGINCNFELDFNGKLINEINLDTYSFELEPENRNITIKPLLDVIDGKYKENYGKKSCPLLINSFFINDRQPILKVENKEDSWIYLTNTSYNTLNILYDINEVSKDSFTTLSFRINIKSHFSINVTYQNKNAQNRSLSKEIYQTTNIFLNSEFLLYNEDNEQTIEPNTGGNLSIIIENKDNETINMLFKIIEKDTISIIEKNALNFGFLTSNTNYQYYYTEVLQGEEGELILHNKRLYGVLYGKIVDKNETNKASLNDTSFYPNATSNETEQIYLNYNQHLLKLNFSYHDTSHCFKGCIY